MTQGFCPNCKVKTDFEKIEKSKFKCTKCSNTFFKCKKKDCKTMISNKVQLWCNECLNNGIKDKHTGKVAVVLGTLAFVGKYAWKNKSKVAKVATKIFFKG